MEPSGRDRWQPMANALALETIRSGCHADRTLHDEPTGVRTMNLRACAHTLDQSHQLFDS